jgi:hypothetical protein
VSDDDRDITQISPDGYLIISESGLLGGSRTLELRGSTGSAIERKFSIGGGARPYEPDGRAWLTETLPTVVRRGGFAADQRVARILKREGPVGVLSEVSRLQTDHVRRVYLSIFLQQARPAGSLLTQTLEQASREISSDFELTGLLITAGTTLTFTAGDWEAFFKAFDSVGSDFEHRRGLSAIADGNLPPEVLAMLLRSAKGIGSSFERASLLVHVIQRHRLEGDARNAYLEAADQISSNFEKSRALAALSMRERR